ncbi:MAG TPA: hypothetical protein VNI58_10760 [Mariprofundaceae bacterium]|nr:hypothetical protein [Mariprofundaceae bacterium]
MSNVKALPGAFPLHENRDFLRESEWVILKLLCRPLDSLQGEQPETLSAATGGQISVERCDELIRIVRIGKLPGLGSWIARILAENGFDDHDIRSRDAADVTAKVNARAGYPLCNDATTRALAALQLQWKGAGLATKDD